MTDAELNGHIDTAEECRDWISHHAMDNGDTSGKLFDFVNAVGSVIAALESARRERDTLDVALTKVSAIRDSIVGMQGFHFSEHAYPLVAVLDGAGYKGAGYEISRANLGTLIEQRDKATAERDASRAEAEQLRAERDAAVPILDAAYRWHDADKILDGENEDNANSREMFNARRNRWRSIESLRAALDAWRTTKGDAGN